MPDSSFQSQDGSNSLWELLQNSGIPPQNRIGPDRQANSLIFFSGIRYQESCILKES